MNKPKFETPDMTQKNIDKISQMFPNCITETKDENGKLKKAVNFELLQQMLSEEIADKDEAYEFTWVGKNAAIVEANKSIRKTLRPCKEESVNWDTTENLYIEGDNLEVLKLLQESYLGKVKMIYIDPPYNTGHDFVYPDSFIMDNEEYNEGTGYFDEDGNVNYSRENSITAGKYHSDWCSMIYSRLLLARNLLSDDGIIFLSIGEEEIKNLNQICDEVFGDSNRIGIVSRVMKTASNNGTYFAPTIDYVLCYAKKITMVKKFQDEVDESLYKKIEKEGSHKGEKYRDDVALYQAALNDLRPNQKFFIECPDGSKVIPPCSKLDEVMRQGDGRWRWSKEKYLKDKDLLVFKETKTSPLVDDKGNRAKYNIYTKSYLSERQETGTLPRNLWSDFINRKGADYLKKLNIPFDFSKPHELISYMMKISDVKDSDIVLDFFSGSGTTADSVMRINSLDKGKRKFILVQVPETTDTKSEAYKSGYKNICEIGKERIRRAGKKIKEEMQNVDENLDIGFRVLKVDDSNMKDVYYSASEYDQSNLDMFESNIKEDRNDLDLLFGCLLDWGLPLSLPYTSETIDKFTVHTYNEGDLIACFNEDVSEDVVKEIARKKPLRAVFRDSSFSNSASKINVFEIFKMISPETSVKVI